MVLGAIEPGLSRNGSKKNRIMLLDKKKCIAVKRYYPLLLLLQFGFLNGMSMC